MDEIILALDMEPLPEGGFVATCPDFPGLVAQGRTAAETFEIAQDVARKLIDSHLEHGDPLPLKVARALKAGPRKGLVSVPVSLPAALSAS